MAFDTLDCPVQERARDFLLLEVPPKRGNSTSFETRGIYPHLPVFIAVIGSFKEIKTKPTNPKQLVNFLSQ